MKKSFLRRLGELCSVYEDTGVNTDRIYDVVSDKIDIYAAKRERIVYRRPALSAVICAAILLMTAVTVTAYYSLSDAFREVLNERNADGDIVPLSEMAPIIDKSGVFVNQTVSSGGFDVTVRGAVGSNTGLKILVDIENTSDEELAFDFAGKGFYFDTPPSGFDDYVYFDKQNPTHLGRNPKYVEYTPYTGPSFNCTTTTVDASEGKVTLLFELDIHGKGENDYFIGRTMYLVFDELLQYEMNGNDSIPRTLSDGQWRFEIPLTFEDMTITAENCGQVNFDGWYEVTAEIIELSPLNIQLYLFDESQPWKEDDFSMTFWAGYMNKYAEITMLDGTVVTARCRGGGPIRRKPVEGEMHPSIKVWMGEPNPYYQNPTQMIQVNFQTEAVIDPAQVESVKIEDLVVQFNS